MGFSPRRACGSPDAVAAMLQSGVASRESLVAAGCAFANADGEARDRFEGRVVLPIRDARKQPLGFGSREIGEPQTRAPGDSRKPSPKFVNSPTTPIFVKGAALFGLDLACTHVRQLDECVLVEGYFDVIALHEIGVRNVPRACSALA